MKTTQKKAVEAYSAINRLAGDLLPARDALGLFKLKKELQTQYDFQVEQEKKLVEAFGGQVKDGFVEFADAETAAKFRKEYKDLNETVVDINFEKVKLESEPKFTINEIGALCDFIEF